MSEKLQYELVVSTRAKGTGAKDTRRELDQLKTTVQGLTDKVRVQEFAHYDLDAALKQETRTTKAAKQSQAQLDVQRVMAKRTIAELAEQERRAAVMAAGATKSTRNLGMATLEASRAFEDAQYGMRGVLNNIPGLIAMLGGSAGLAGVVSVAAVGFSILWKQVEKFQQEAKEAESAGEEMTEQLREFLAEVEGRNLEGFIEDLERFEQTERNLADASTDALSLEHERRQSLERVADQLREAAELEIKLAKARGLLTDEQARAQLNALEGEAEAAVQQAQLRLLDDKVAMARKAHEDQLRIIERLGDQEADLERKLAEQQGRSASLNQEAQPFRNASRDGPLPDSLQRKFEDIEHRMQAADAAVEETLTALQDVPGAIQDAMVEAGALAQEVDNAIARREIGANEIEQIADIAQEGAEVALTTAAVEARAVLEEELAKATAVGQQLGEDQRAAFGVLNEVLADGVVQAGEVEKVTQVVERLTTSREQVDRKVLAAFDRMLTSADGLAGKVASQDARLNALETRINALNSQRR